MLLESDSYHTYLSEEFERRAKHNPRYSLRAFASGLGMSPGELSEILSGKRKLSLKSVLRISKALNLNTAEIRHLTFLAQKEKVDNHPAVGNLLSRNPLTLDMFSVVADWFCFAILNLMDCENFRWNENWISKRLGISRIEVHTALKKLERVGLLERKGNKLTPTKDYVLSPDGIPSEAIRHYHEQILKKAVDALHTQTMEERLVSGMSLAINPKAIKSLKKELTDFLDEIANKYSKTAQKKEVYQVEFALFRLTSGGVHA